MYFWSFFLLTRLLKKRPKQQQKEKTHTNLSCVAWPVPHQHQSGKKSIILIGSEMHFMKPLTHRKSGSLSVTCCPHPSINKRLRHRQLTNTDLLHGKNTDILHQTLYRSASVRHFLKSLASQMCKPRTLLCLVDLSSAE